MSYSILEIANKLQVHPSVIENYEEEWLFNWKSLQIDQEFYDETFFEFLCRIFAECAFCVEATERGADAMGCLEAYDDIYSATEAILGVD